MSPDTTVKTAAHVATGASHMLNRTSTFLNYAYGTSSVLGNQDRRSFHNGVESKSEGRDQGWDRDQEHEQEEYIDEETGILNKEG